MKTGFNLLLWTGFVDDSHLPVLEALKKTGYDGVEVPVFDGDPEHYAKLGKKLDDMGLDRTVVTIIPDEEHNLLSAKDAHRKAGVKRLKWAVDCCEALNAEVMVGPFHQPLAVFSGDPPTEEEKQRAAACHQEVADYAKKTDLRLAIEALNRFECYFLNTMADAADYVRRVDRPNFVTMYDSFHANIEEKDPIGAVRAHADVIGQVHISENDRGTPGRGHFDWDGLFAALKEVQYDGWLTVEAFGRALPELAAATRVWRDFFPSREQVYTEGLQLIRTKWGG